MKPFAPIVAIWHLILGLCAVVASQESSEELISTRRKTTAATCFTDGTVNGVQPISMTSSNFNSFYTLSSGNRFGASIAALGDIDGGGIGDIAIGAPGDDDIVKSSGAVYVLFLETDGSIKNVQKISALRSGLGDFITLNELDLFGSAVTALGVIDGDKMIDIAVSACLRQLKHLLHTRRRGLVRPFSRRGG
jgi:hypothetical protein